MDRMTADLEGAAAGARLIVLGKPIPGVRERLPAGVPVLDITRLQDVAERLTLAAPPRAAAFPLDGYHRVPRPMRLSRRRGRCEILFLYSRPPLPMTRGDELTVSHLLEFLHARGHAVDFVTLIEPGQRLRPEHEAWLREPLPPVELIPHSAQAQPAARRARPGSRGRPFQIGLLPQPAQLARVRELVAREPLRHGLRLLHPLGRGPARGRAGAGPGSATFMALQLSQTLNTERLARTAGDAPGTGCSTASRPGAWPAYEARLWRDVTRTVLIGEQDTAAIAQGLPRARACPRSTTSSGGRTASTSSGSRRGPGPRSRTRS